MENTFKVKDYKKRVEKNLNGDVFYVLSFDSSCHLKVSKKAMAIIELMNGKFENEEIVRALNSNGISITLKELEYFAFDFLLPRNVLIGEDNRSITVNDNKLWFHLPIMESSKLIWLYKILKVMLCKPLVISLLVVIVTCVIYSAVILLNFKGNFINEINSLQILVLVYLSMFVHEVGHATAAYKYGVKVGKMGIGLYLIYFVFFIDMTNTWKLDRKKRIINDLSGIYFQSFLVIPLFAIYMSTKDISLLCALIIIVGASLMNLIPFLRMDGYWLLTDYLSIQNIQIKAISSIKVFIGECKKMISAKYKHQTYIANRQVWFYGIYSFAYVFSTVFMLFFIIISIGKLAINFNDLTNKFTSLFDNLIQGEFNKFFLDLNNLFIILIPIIFIAIFVISNCRKVIQHKLILRKAREKK